MTVSRFLLSLDKLHAGGKLGLPQIQSLKELHQWYTKALIQSGSSLETGEKNLSTFLDKLLEQVKSPFIFSSYHDASREPFDYYAFSQEFIGPIIDQHASKIIGNENIAKIDQFLKKGENVIFLANHQTETDSTILNIMLGKEHPHLVKNLIHVAGHRVTTDPFAVPISRGCNLLCIWSKRYIENPPEEKAAKSEHNQRTIRTMHHLLNEGGKAIYVAPSGGRDRADEEGIIRVAPFDPTAVELFLLSARQAARPTHIFPMGLSTYQVLPPPKTILKELGEPRHICFAPVQIHIGDEINLKNLYDETSQFERRQQREQRALIVWNIVNKLYQDIG